ncbi:MAG: extracellular solute-binding protein [Lachnospiraceae bacterium]|nr:extracellular solute-binding protein [Lachnospiraceae bacterium]
MKKRLMALVLAASLCQIPQIAMAGEADSAEKEEITLSIAKMIEKDVAPNHDAVTKLLKEKFNINVEWQDVSSKEQLNLQFSTGRTPDIIWNYNGEADVKRWGSQGYLYALDEYLDELPNYQAMFTEEQWETTHTYAQNADGNLYYLPTRNIFEVQEVWIYRTGMLDELGMEIPTTTDELYDVLKAFKEKYPDLEELVYGPSTDKFRDMLIYVAKLYEEGLVDPELQTATDTQWEEVYANGLNILEYSYANRASWANNTMMDADPDANWACTEEGQRWFSAGEEGITYDIVDGDLVLKDHV